MGQSLKGKNAVITGAGRGIGRDIALLFAREGASVVVNNRRKETSPADETVAEITKAGGTAVANYDTVADFEGAGRIIQTCVDSFGKIDILCNVAGITREKMIFNMSEEEWDEVIAVHLKGTFNCVRHASPLMREQKSGRIINTASQAWLGTAGQANYAAAKGGIVSFTAAVSQELGKYGITCNAVVPTAKTRMTFNENTVQGFRKRFEAGLISKDRMDMIMDPPGPEHIAPMVAYLASDAASNINGQVFRIEARFVGIYSTPVIAKALYHDYKECGPWTVEELTQLVPATLLTGYVNPAPRKEEPRSEK